mgnify:CR=1 FL=1
MPVYNRCAITLQCLRSLERVDSTGLEIKIFIVDDGSTDGTSDAIRADFPDVQLIAGDGTLHYAAGTNRGVEAAMEWGADFVVTMNDDAVYHDQFLQRLIKTANDNPRSIVGGLLLLWDEPHKVFQVAPKWKTFQGGWIFPEDLTAFNVGKEPFEVECIVGNCVMFPIEALRECGLMDEVKFPHGWGDAQWLARFRREGWRLLVDPTVYVWCEPNTYPAPLHKAGFGKLISILFSDRKHPQNLQRQWIARTESAPSKTKAVFSFGAYLAEIFVKSVQYGVKRLVPRSNAS